MKFVLHKLLNLGVPYLAFSTVYIVINSMVPGVNSQNELSDILWIWRDSTAQYWFLYALFGLFVLYAVLSGAMSNWQITLTLVLSLYFAPAFGVSFGSFGTSVSMALAFGLGTVVKSLIFDKQKAWVRVGIIIGHLLIVGFLIKMSWNDLPIVKHFEQVVGIAASISLISLLMQIGQIKKFLLFINKYSFPIYLLHTIFTAGVRIALNQVGMTNYWIHITVGMLFGVIFPFLGAWITNKIPVVDFFLYPSKNINRLKNKQ